MIARRRGIRRAAALLAGLFMATVAGAAAADDAAIQQAAAAMQGEPLVGVGIVIGLDGTGDSSVDPAIIDSSIVGVMRRAGLEPWQGQIEAGRIAAVMLTAALPAGAPDGTPLEISVHAIGDAVSLDGGTLLVAPLRDDAGVTYAVGKGSLATAGREGSLAEPAKIERPDAGRAYASLP